MTDKLTVRIEGGSMYYESHEGDWMTEDEQEEIIGFFSDEIDSLSDDPNVANAIRQSRQGVKVFLATIKNPMIETEPGTWTNHGYDPGYIYLDWDDTNIAVEPLPDPPFQHSKDQMTFADILGTEQ